MRVLFWGTSDFAAPALGAIVGEGFEVCGVVTQPDRAVGRSRSQLHPSPVKVTALREGLTVLQPEEPRGDAFLAALRAADPDISVVASYGHILRSDVIALPRLGTINIHASLLPALRGASPIQAAIRAGLTETGITIMRMEPALDAGPIILQARTPIAEDETAGELALRLSELGALALVEALTLIDLGQATERPQDAGAASYAGKIDRQMARIDWRQGCAVVARHIRAYDPRPGAFTTQHGSDVKLFGAAVIDAPPVRATTRPGQVVHIDADGIVVACGEGAVRIAAAQPAGKRRLSPAEWARGRGIAAGEMLGD